MPFTSNRSLSLNRRPGAASSRSPAYRLMGRLVTMHRSRMIWWAIKHPKSRR